MLVQPCIRRKTFLVYLSCRQECLCIFTVYVVSVYVHIIESIILSYTLSLIVKGLCGNVVIDSYVGDCFHVVAYIISRKVIICLEGFHINILKAIRILSVFYISFEVLAFLIDFIRCYYKILNKKSRSCSQKSYYNHHYRNDNRRLCFFLFDAYCKSYRCNNRKGHNDSVHPKSYIYISKSGTVYGSRATEKQIVLFQEKVYTDHKEKQHSHNNKLLFRNGNKHSEVIVIKGFFLFRQLFGCLSSSARKALSKLSEHIVQIIKTCRCFSKTASAIVRVVSAAVISFVINFRFFFCLFKNLRSSYRKKNHIIYYRQYGKCNKKNNYHFIEFFDKSQFKRIK